MLSDELRWELRQEIRQRVGAFFRNVKYAPEGIHCAVCGIPPEGGGELCSKCSSQRIDFGNRLASQVLILTYVKGHAPGGRHQSAHTVRAYKQMPSPAEKCAEDLASMVAAATVLHKECIEAAYGPWSVVTFVPSANNPGSDHPVAGLARHVIGNNNPHKNRILLGIGPGISRPPERTVRSDRFIVPSQYVERIQDQHVLVVDDTWISGGKVQSAAVALKDAGAAHVTVLCVARWTNYTWRDHQQMLDSLNDHYDALICPVTGENCAVPHV